MNQFIIYLKNIFFQFESFVLGFKQKKDIVFVVHNEVMFSDIYHIYCILKNDKRLRLWFCFVTPNRFENLYSIKRKFKLKNIPYWIAEKLRWDLVLYPDHGPYFRKKCLKILVGHGLNTGKKVIDQHYFFGHWAYDKLNKIIYKKIFRTSEYLKLLTQKYYPEIFPFVKIVGSLQADALLDYDVNIAKRKQKLNFNLNKKTILIASSWGTKALIHTQGFNLIPQFKILSQEYNIILTIHLNNYDLKFSEGVDWKEEFNKVSCENVYIQPPAGNPYSLLPLADLMITDMTSLGLYFTLFKQPIIFIDNVDIDYTSDALIPLLRNSCYVVDNICQLSEKIEQGFKNFNQYKIEELTKKVFSYLGSAKTRYKEEIYDCLNLSII